MLARRQYRHSAIPDERGHAVCSLAGSGIPPSRDPGHITATTTHFSSIENAVKRMTP